MTIEQTLDDVAYAARSYARTPGFTLAAVLALALGIGAATAVFSVVDPLLFRPLPYAGADRLASIGMSAPIEPNEWLLAPDYLEWRERQSAFSSLTSLQGRRTCDLTDGEPSRLHCGVVEASFLPVMGITLAAGRNFSLEEDQPKAAPVALISHALWQSRFGAATNILGRKLELDGKPTEIIGILPASFEWTSLQQIDFLVPLRLDIAQQRQRQSMMFLRVFGRLREGVTLDQARASLVPLFDHAMNFVPPAFRNEVKLRVTGFRERQVHDFRTASLVLVGAVLCVLLVACANVANLMLARGASREREIAVRAAIGASHARLLRQTLTESLLLGAISCFAGVGLAWTLLALFRGIAPDGIPRLASATLDWRVLAFAVVLSLIAGVAAGAASLWKMPSAASLVAGPRATNSSGLGRDWLRPALAALQVAVSLVLLSSSGLLLRSLWRMQEVDLGISSGQVLTSRLDLSRERYRTPEQLRAFYLELERRLATIPGAETVALTDSLPPSDQMQTMIFSRILKEGQAEDLRNGTGGMVVVRTVTPAYFPTLKIPVVAGRAFTEDDRTASPDQPLLVIDETLARRLFPGQPVQSVPGRRLRPGGGNGPWYTIAGVVREVRNAGIATASDPEYYHLLPSTGDWPRRGLSILIRTPRDASAMSQLIRQTVQSLDAKLPVEVERLDSRVRQLTARPRFNATLLALFAFLALALASIGLAGVVSYLAARRTREIGVRMALGATPAGIQRMVLGQSLLWILGGVALGLAATLASTRWLRSLLFAVEPADPVVLLTVVATLTASAIAAAWLPARRASRLDPMSALRHE